MTAQSLHNSTIATRAVHGMRHRASVRLIVSYVLLSLGFAWFAYPLAWLILGSLKPVIDFAQIPARIWPSEFHPENYVLAWNTMQWGRFFVNSFVLVSINIIGTTLSCSLAAYGFARLRFWGRDTAFVLLLATMMLPGWVTLIPTFIIFREMGWINTWLPLSVPSFFGAGSSIFLMRQFFMTLPRELDEAAKLDGCNELGIYWRILLPLSKPVLATVSIFTFIGVWNSFLIPLIYLHSETLFTVSIGLAFLRNAISGELTGTQAMPIQALLLAASVFASVPLIGIFFVGQKYFVRGIALTGRSGM